MLGNTKKRILITGANGFIGKNLLAHISRIDLFRVLLYSRESTESDLKDYIQRSDLIVHLAGENRPIDITSFEISNVQLTQKICDYASQNQNKIPIIFSSSVQVQNKNPYGVSKSAAEDIIKKYSEKNKVPVISFRFPGIFGKWAKPNYNSVVATFCFNIANCLPIELVDKEKKLTLCYIDDIIELIIQAIYSIDKYTGYSEINVPGQYLVTLSQLLEKIYAFSDSKKNLQLSHVGSGFDRALYATYTSYLPKYKFSYGLKIKTDERGSFTEVLKTIDSGQISFLRINPGHSRGKHFHHTKIEKFIVVSGVSKFRFRNTLIDEVYEIEIDGSSMAMVVETIPGWAHEIINIGTQDLVVLVWSNEIFDPNKPDTIASVV